MVARYTNDRVMKISAALRTIKYQILSLSIFACLVLKAEESESEISYYVRKDMERYGWNTEEVTVEELGEHTGMAKIMRTGKLVGYYYAESKWELADVDAIGVGEVTRITYGYDPEINRDYQSFFEVTDRDVIALWVSAYNRHTESIRNFHCFVPSSEDAGFSFKREEYGRYSHCMCSLALRFYQDDDELLEIKGHLDTSACFDPEYRNKVLHELVKLKVPKKEAVVTEVADDDDIDPFAEIQEK